MGHGPSAGPSPPTAGRRASVAVTIAPMTPKRSAPLPPPHPKTRRPRPQLPPFRPVVGSGATWPRSSRQSPSRPLPFCAPRGTYRRAWDWWLARPSAWPITAPVRAKRSASRTPPAAVWREGARIVCPGLDAGRTPRERILWKFHRFGGDPVESSRPSAALPGRQAVGADERRRQSVLVSRAVRPGLRQQGDELRRGDPVSCACLRRPAPAPKVRPLPDPGPSGPMRAGCGWPAAFSLLPHGPNG